MASDAHCHPYDLGRLEEGCEEARWAAGVACAASAWRGEEFLFLEAQARAAREGGGPPMALCFASHPQLPAFDPVAASRAVELLADLVASRRVNAIGELGFDLFDDVYRGTLDVQTELFEAQLALALEAGLPVVLHLRRAIDRSFAYSRDLARLPAVVLHSYSGTRREGEDLLKRGVNAFFSFGTTVALNHRRAMEACARLPLDRLLLETDAPYQPLRGRDRSTWTDLATVISAAAALRAEAGCPGAEPAELESATDANFRRVFLSSSPA